MNVSMHVWYSFHTDGFEWVCSVWCQQGNKFLHLCRPAGHTCRRRCRTRKAMWCCTVVIPFDMTINCGTRKVDTRLFPFEVRRAVFIAVTCICAVINHSSQNQWQCLIQTKTRATRSAHSSVANVLFNLDRFYLSARKICNFIRFKLEVMRNKIRLFTIVSQSTLIKDHILREILIEGIQKNFLE